ncbi:choice-of-anchor A family protein [Stigmatella aurantiaca]|uniref:choice-of-anchor A family protein n=1 Tax=Stigmatella aurantiaca TaxID=41 RepID=UPI001FE99E70|nr:choice-of-anchor A family protein [Stigmatella aurantiaca]
MNYLVPDVAGFSRSNGCVACHRQGAALFAAASSQAAGYAVDASESSGLGYVSTFIQQRQWPSGQWEGPGEVDPSGYALFGLAGYDKWVSTRYSQQLVKAVEWALPRQQPNGAWISDYLVFPVNYGNVQATARIMTGIAQAKARVDSAKAAQYQNALTAAADWLRANRSNTDATVMAYNFQGAYALLGLDVAGATSTDPDVQFLQQRLLSNYSHSTNQGWGYSASDAADEFNTGVVLYSLCRTGVSLRNNERVRQAVNWLRDRQVNHGVDKGYWRSASFATVDIPTTFAILGLSCFGELGVKISAEGEDRVIIDAHAPAVQTLTFSLKVENLGAFDAVDTYAITVQGGLPGWNASVSPSPISLTSGQSSVVTLTVEAPPLLPEGLPVQFTVEARSQTNSAISASTTVTVLTNPPPPVTGLQTETILTAGANVTVTSRTQPQPLSATPRIASSHAPIAGPGRGVVTFYIAGSAVGTDADEDGDGTFRIDWIPGPTWGATGVQDFRAIYSGIDLPGPQQDLLPSLIASSINLQLGEPGPVRIDVRLGGYNLFLEKDYTGGHDVHGKVAAGGNISMTGFSVGVKLPDNNIANTLVAGGNLTLSHGGVWGNAFYGGSYSGDTSTLFARGTLAQGKPINFTAQFAGLRGLSTQLGNLKANGTVTREAWGGVMLSGTNAKVNVFDVDASAFIGAVVLTVNAPGGSLVVINIRGTSATFTGIGNSFSGGIDAHGILYNFVDATAITAQGYGFWGTVLAPKADITFNNGSFNGGIYAKSLTGDAEGHLEPLTDHDIYP